MACSKPFKRWVEQEGAAKVAGLISEYESARGRRGVTRQAVQQWLTNGVPMKRIPAVSQMSGIAPHDLSEFWAESVA